MYVACSTTSCLSLDLLDSFTEPEGAVVIQFSAHGGAGKPATGMESGDFVIKEDGQPISAFESQQQIVPQEASYELVSLLLIDMSGSIIESDNLKPLQDAATSYVHAMPDWIRIGIYRFDGRAEMHEVVDFTSDHAALIDGIESLSEICDEDACDPSTNLHGAIVSGIRAVDTNLPAANSHRIVGGSMVVFTDGTDRASRVSEKEALDKVNTSEHAVYSIGLGGEIDKGFLKKVGKDGFAFTTDIDEIGDAFNEIAEAIVDEANSLYTLIYCSPSRDGEHTVTIEGTWGTLRGTFKTEFDTHHFDEELVAWCDPEAIYTGESVGPPPPCIEDICSGICGGSMPFSDCYGQLQCVADSDDPECLCACATLSTCPEIRECAIQCRSGCE